TDLTARPAGLQRQVFAQRIAALFQCLEQGCAERVLLVDRRPWREGAEPEDFWRRLRERRARAGNRRASEHGDEVSSSHSHCVPQARIVQGRRFAPYSITSLEGSRAIASDARRGSHGFGGILLLHHGHVGLDRVRDEAILVRGVMHLIEFFRLWYTISAPRDPRA